MKGDEDERSSPISAACSKLARRRRRNRPAAARPSRQRADRHLRDRPRLGRRSPQHFRRAFACRAGHATEQFQSRRCVRGADRPLAPRRGPDPALCPRHLRKRPFRIRHVAVVEEQPVPDRFLVPGRDHRSKRHHALQQYRRRGQRRRPSRPGAFQGSRGEHRRLPLHQQAGARPRLEQMVDPAHAAHLRAGRRLRRRGRGVARPRISFPLLQFGRHRKEWHHHPARPRRHCPRARGERPRRDRHIVARKCADDAAHAREQRLLHRPQPGGRHRAAGLVSQGQGLSTCRERRPGHR